MRERASGGDTESDMTAGDQRNAWGKQRNERMTAAMRPHATSSVPPSKQYDAPAVASAPPIVSDGAKRGARSGGRTQFTRGRRDGMGMERRGDGMGNAPVFADQDHIEEPQDFKALARKHFKND